MDTLQQRLRYRWEELPARRQAAIAYPLVTAVLLAVHAMFFHRITLARSVGYAIFEGLLVTAMIVAASQAEAAARKRREQHDDAGE